jgi:hypothetical protein
MLGPYTNHYRGLGEPIREIVRRGQDTLVRLYLGGKHQERLDYAEKALSQVAHCRDMPPPQTLGELGLEALSDTIRSMYMGKLPIDHPRYPVSLVFREYSHVIPGPREATLVRRAMYHKNLDIEKEKRTQRIEKAIIIVGKEIGLYQDLGETR